MADLQSLKVLEQDYQLPVSKLMLTCVACCIDELEEKVQDYAARMARQATGAIARIKRCVNTGLYQGIATGLAEEQDAVVENFESPDLREGLEAFLAGRKPQFRG